MIYQDQNDGTLVMLTLAGEPYAYEVLVSRWEKTVIAAAQSVLHSRYMAEDAAQDAFVTAWMKLNILREPAKFGSWVCRIAVNCAKNTVVRYRNCLSLDLLEDTAGSADGTPDEMVIAAEEVHELHRTVSLLPEKVRDVIRYHYFEELSVAEIAVRMGISQGTVKSQLHDGRKRIRKELCAMNEEMNDTLLQRVMKKVAELKKWQFRNSKNGFETMYRDVLKEVEALPESSDKYHALADVLVRGWWWIPGEKNDALLREIREAAEKGKNDEVMAFAIIREAEKLYGGVKLDYIRNTQIPRLEKRGFRKALGAAWFWLGYYSFRDDRTEDGFAAYEKAMGILPQSELFHAYAGACIGMEKRKLAYYSDIPADRYRLRAIGEELRAEDDGLRLFDHQWSGEGYLCSADLEADFIFRNASYCDGFFTVKGLAPGETHTGSDGTALTYGGKNHRAEAVCGVFEDCELWITEHRESVFRTWFRDGVGIVRQERDCGGMTEVRTLKSFAVKGGEGLLPMAAGNTWAYTGDFDPDVMEQAAEYTVEYAGGEKVVLSGSWELFRKKYDENSWPEMMQKVRNDYCREIDGEFRICDVSDAMDRARQLAVTPMEKAHTEAACSAAQRIMDTDPVFNPSCTATGHWNFFSRDTAVRKEDAVVLTDDFRWSFEWKNMEDTPADTPLLFNDIYGILQDAVNCVWSDQWKPGAVLTTVYERWSENVVKTEIRCEDAGRVVTKAGTFENCLTVHLDICGLSGGMEYRGGRKDYTFAPGVGIVRAANAYWDNARTAVYELVSFDGTGDGYFPLVDGLVRRYEAQNLTDGYVGAAEYTYVAGDDGKTVIFTDRTGIRQIQAPVTSYSSIQDELTEDRLWEEGKHAESRLRHDVNNFRLLAHFFGRPSRYWAAQEKAAAWNQYRLRIMEGLGDDGEVPPAWWGHYASTCFRTGCALCGCGRKEEGYEYLERAFTLFEKWNTVADGEEMDVGDPLIYGGVRVIKGKSLIRLPDGTVEPLPYPHLFQDKAALMYHGMTAPHGWEWFNGVRNEERFKDLIRRAEKLL